MPESPKAPVTPPPAPPRPRAPKAPDEPSVSLTFEDIPNSAGHSVVVYGTGGVGKSTLAASAPGPVAFFDLDDSLPKLKQKLTAMELLGNVRRVPGVSSWDMLRASLKAPGWDGIKTLVIDTGTVAEEMCVAHTLGTVKTDGGSVANSIESYGYGKGYQHAYEAFIPLLGDLDAHTRAGRHVILVCHDCSNTVPNPQGADWIRYEPRLQTSASGKSSIRLRVKEWADHVLFIGYDVDVDAKRKKARGHGTATIYPRELPFAMAKSRTLIDAIPLDECFDGSLWKTMFV